MILLLNSVSASITGFENPTTVYRKSALNLTDMFINSPSSMFMIESPESHVCSGISKGDWLLVDSSKQPYASDQVLIERFDEQYVRNWGKLQSVSQKYSESCDELIILGVITLSIHHFRTPPNLPNHMSLNELNFHHLLVEFEHSTVICRADGESMLPYIHHGDLILLERHIKPKENDVCILALNNDLVCKRVHLRSRYLSSDNPKFKSYKVQDADYLRLHGVVRYSFRLHRALLCTPS